MSYLGNAPGVNNFTLGVDRFSANGSGRTFTLSRDIDDTAAVDIHISGVWQEPTAAYTINNGVITFISTPAAGSNNVVVVYRDPTVVTFNSVSTSQLEAGSVTSSRLATGAVIDSISVGQITGNLIATTSIRANQIVSSTITGNLIAATSIRGNQIATSTLTSNLFASGAIAGNVIADTSIRGNQIATSTLTSNLFATNTLTGDKIALSSVSGNVIIANTVTGNLIGQSAISSNNFASNLTISGLTITGNGLSVLTGNITVASSNIISGNVLSTFLTGYNQVITDVTGSRSVGTTYTNTTGRPILLFVNITGSGTVQWFIDGTSIGTNAGNGIITLYVPAGSTYQTTLSSGSQTLTSWFELR